MYKWYVRGALMSDTAQIAEPVIVFKRKAIKKKPTVSVWVNWKKE